MNTEYKTNGSILMATYIGCVMLITGAVGCTNDAQIKADIAVKAKTDINFAGVNYAVENKVVTLTGSCPSGITRAKVLQTVRSISVIKGVNNQIKIAPVTLNEIFPVKQAVDSILANYPTVQADVTMDEIVLHGKTTQPDADKLLTSIGKLRPPRIQNQLTIQ